MSAIKSICVYCAASTTVEERYFTTARELGASAAKAGYSIVFGAGGVGLMGALADGALAAGGQVVGVIPEHLERRELGHKGIGEYLVVKSMHERKQLMFERADAFCILPGGLGTLDEAFEVITWRQLGLHDKPIFLLNFEGFWNPFLALVDHLHGQRFIHGEPKRLFQTIDSVPDLLSALSRTPATTVASESSKM